MTTIDMQAIHTEAYAAAKKAASNYFYNILGGQDRYACGFAWVVVKCKGNSKIWNQLKTVGFSKPYGRTGHLHLWMTSTMPCQNVDVHESAASAYAAVLREHGIDAYADSRLD